jgi:hypothetical protein
MHGMNIKFLGMFPITQATEYQNEYAWRRQGLRLLCELLLKRRINIHTRKERRKSTLIPTAQ